MNLSTEASLLALAKLYIIWDVGRGLARDRTFLKQKTFDEVKSIFN